MKPVTYHSRVRYEHYKRTRGSVKHSSTEYMRLQFNNLRAKARLPKARVLYPLSLMDSKTEGARNDVLNPFLQTDLVVLAPKCLDVYDFACGPVELLNGPKARNLDLADQLAALRLPCLLCLKVCGIVFCTDYSVRGRRQGRGNGKMGVKQLIQQSARVVMRDVHVILTVSQENRDVDILYE